MQYLTFFPHDSASTFKANSRYIFGGDSSPSSAAGSGGSWSDEVERQRRVKIVELGLHLASFDDSWDPAQPFAQIGAASLGGSRDPA
eukprot:COSAG05_NODE_1570_length_4527_cov_4.173216_3_plen_87_part_00